MDATAFSIVKGCSETTVRNAVRDGRLDGHAPPVVKGSKQAIEIYDTPRNRAWWPRGRSRPPVDALAVPDETAAAPVNLYDFDYARRLVEDMGAGEHPLYTWEKLLAVKRNINATIRDDLTTAEKQARVVERSRLERWLADFAAAFSDAFDRRGGVIDVETFRAITYDFDARARNL